MVGIKNPIHSPGTPRKSLISMIIPHNSSLLLREFGTHPLAGFMKAVAGSCKLRWGAIPEPGHQLRGFNAFPAQIPGRSSPVKPSQAQSSHQIVNAVAW
jgi:hypothetical protein